MVDKLVGRFRRLLLMVPYVIQRPGVSVDEVCKRFEINKATLIKDLDLLMMCGLPGYSPGDLIEASVVRGEVVIRLADYFSRPQRLTPAEALLLYSAAQALAAAGEPDANLVKAMARLADVLGPEALSRVSVDVGQAKEVGAISEAIQQGRRLHIRHQSQAREEMTERDVDPWALFLQSGRWYLVGWCHKVTDERIFRLDRIKDVLILDTKADIPQDIDLSKYEGLYLQATDATEVVLELAPQAKWVLDQYRTLESEVLPGGWTRIKLAAGGTAWLERLLLRLGPNARVVTPTTLADAVINRAKRLRERYAD
ncbi:MAG: WYL domain-containing protein [Actinomycetota bacterium]